MDEEHGDCVQHSADAACGMSDEKQLVERLRRLAGSLDIEAADAIARLGKEVERLRAALERIANQSAVNYADPEEEAYASREIAREALKHE